MPQRQATFKSTGRAPLSRRDCRALRLEVSPINNSRRNRCLAGCLGMALWSLGWGISWADDLDAGQAAALKKMSLEQLLAVPVQASGSLTPTPLQMTPVAITVITAEDIRLTPHRNLLDLIEVYVPGAEVMTHSDGMKLGMRGIISDRNMKFLLLVNGRNMNQTAHSGAAAELTNWDLTDIERVEIIRGPGSATYGPGAVAGVINIITKTAADVPRPEVTVKYTGGYDSKMAAFSYGLKQDRFEFTTHLSIAATDGLENTKAFSLQSPLSGGYGFLGTHAFPAGSASRNPPPEYFADFSGEPQYKAHFDLKFLDEWRLWARITSSGGNVDYRNSQAAYQQGLDASGRPVFSGLESYKQIQNREGTVQLENSHEVTSWFTLDSAFGWVSQDYERRNFAPLTYTTNTPVWIQQDLGNPGSVRNVVQNFAEDDLHAQLLARLQPQEDTKLVLGAEYLASHFGPGWGDNPQNFRMGESGKAGIPNILNGPNSYGINPPSVPTPIGTRVLNGLNPADAIFVGNGWWTQMYSLLGEVSFQQLSWFNVILSARMDKHDDTDYLFSPRLAIISELNKRNYLKFSLQQSVRMGTAEQMLVSHLRGQHNQPEQLRAIELAYDTLLTDHLHMSLTAFYNQLDVVGWNSAVSNTVTLGTQKDFGLEFETRYSTDNLTVGLNHSYVKLLDWKEAPHVTSTGVSFSDYGLIVKDSAGHSHTLMGTGNDLANWADNVTKVYVNYKFLKHLTFHTDARVYWGMDGSHAQFAMVRQAAAGTPDEALVDAAIADAERQGAFGIDFRTNASLTWDVRDNISVQVFVLNLINATGNKRYDYDTGTTALAPRVFFVEEPRTVGVMARVKF